MKLNSYNPIQKLDYVFDYDNFFENEFSFKNSMHEPIEPRFIIKDEDSAFFVEVSIPGFDKDEINLEVKDNTLVVSGLKKENKNIEGNVYRDRGMFCSNFKKYFNLDEDIERENISAEVKNGILTINLPKKEKAIPMSIPITVN